MNLILKDWKLRLQKIIHAPGHATSKSQNLNVTVSKGVMRVSRLWGKPR